MKISRESIFISAIRSFFNTLLGTIGVFVAIIPSFIIFSIFAPSDQKEGFKNKLEILPDLNSNTKILSLNTPAILQIDIHGVIGKAHLTSTDINYLLIESRKSLLKNDRVKGILLHINSPGGEATDSDNIYRNLLAYSEKYNVPIYVYIDGFCTSGSFYIACSADKIYASPMSMIGSVGAILGPFFNFSKAFNNWGIDTATLTEGKNKDMMNPFRPWTKNEDKALVDINDYIYKRFVNIVAQARNIDENKIINEYGANIFDSQKAKEIGYIDFDNSSYDQALKDLLNEAKIDTSKPYQVVSLTPKKLWYQPLFLQTKTIIYSLMKDFLLSLKFINSN
jgi:signal peptide peptidase SppA